MKSALQMEDEDPELQAALSMSVGFQDTGAEEKSSSSFEMKDGGEHLVANDSKEEPDASMVDNPGSGQPQVNEALLADVMSMGFPELRVRKALLAGCSDPDAAVNWVLEHGEDLNIDEPIAALVAKAWRCVETGRLFATMDEVQAYAEKTKRSNFEETGDEKKALSPEEIAAKKAALKEKLLQRRAENEEV
jgi:uncharacterized UBP type Zn finger protein